MNENYRTLGDYIEMVDERNKDLAIDNLLGVSIAKKFIPSIANIVGTDLSNYKIVRTGQFAYGPVTSRNGEKISIAFLDGDDCIISSSYTVFRVTKENELDPEYLMLWFSRPEFDRYARYKSHGSVREIFDWSELCMVELPVPDIEEQRNIVKAYKTITDRIALKQKINDNLVREIFDWSELCMVELPVPDIEEQRNIVKAYKTITDRIALKQKINDNLVAVGTASIQKNVGRCALINLTEAEMDRLTLPDNFEIQTVSEFCRETKSGSTPSRTNNAYWENGTISWVKSGEVHNNITLQTEEYITPLGLSESSTKLLPKDTVLMAMYGVTAGEVGYLAIEATTNQAICGMICNSKADAAYLYFSLIQSQAAISRLSNGGAQDNLSKNFIDNIKIVVPPSEFIEKLNLAAIVEQMTLNAKEIALLEELQATALAQLSSR